MRALSHNEIEAALLEDEMSEPLTSEQLQRLNTAAQQKQAPLTDGERDVVLWGKVQPKIRYGVTMQQTVLTDEKLQQLRDAALSMGK